MSGLEKFFELSVIGELVTKKGMFGTLGGSLSYDAHISGTSGRVIMHYSDYADYYIHTNGKIDASPLDSEDEIIGTANGLFLLINGNTNTSAGMDMAGSMDGTVT